MAWSYNSVTVNGNIYSQDTAITLPAGTTYYNSADGKAASGYGTLSAAKTVYYYGYNDLYVGKDGYDPAPYYFCATAGGSPTGSGGWKYMKAIDLPKATYTISYNANGGSGVPSSQTKTYGVNLTLSSAKPTRTGYTFKGWALSKADADNGTWYYQAGGTCGKNENLALYAVWEIISYNVTINCNGGSGVNSRTYTVETANFTLGTPTRTGYTFLGWTGSNGSTAQKAVTISKGSTGNKSYTANWSENKLTVNYYSNYATYGTYKGESLNVSVSANIAVHTQDFLYDNSYNSALSNVQNKDYLYLSRIGYTPTGYWGTSTAGGTLIDEDADYSTGQSLAQALGKNLSSGNASINVYPQWQINTYTINYNPNGGTGNMNSQTVDWNNDFVLSNNLFKREGYKFVGWNAHRNKDDTWYVIGQGWLTEDDITANGYEKKMYANQDELTFNNSWVNGDEYSISEYTMYAVWEISGVVYIDNGTSFEPYLAYIDNGTNWEPYIMYVDNGINWDIIS